MVYIAYEKLTLIELRDNEDQISFQRLAKVLLNRPSNVIWCERKRRLCGIISMGDIARAKKAGRSSVAVNKNFMHISDSERFRARHIFSENKHINAFPVLDSAGRLAGSYVRWDDLLSQGSFAGKIRDLHKFYERIILVRPSRGLDDKYNLYRAFKAYLISQNITVASVEHDEIAVHLQDAKWIVFVDEDELRAVETVFTYILETDMGETKFITCKNFMNQFRYNLNRESMEQYLQDLSGAGVTVLNLVFQVNDNNRTYYETICKDVRDKYHAIGEEANNVLYANMYADFFDDMYTDEYADSIVNLRYTVETVSGFKMLKDCNSEFYHVVNGERVTYGQPADYQKTIYFVGPCYIYGYYVEDKHTIESFLQRRLNENGYRIRVVNCGSVYNAENRYFGWMRMKALPLRRGDIVVYGGCDFNGVRQLNLTNVCQKHNVSAKWITNALPHCNYKMNALFADAIYHELFPVLQSTAGKLRGGDLVKSNEDFIKTTYIDRYFHDLDMFRSREVGSIVMNCNPFTLGHRHLIAYAADQVDYLIIFVVEEDRSFFSFSERFAMVCNGVADLRNVIVVPSGPFILSQTTFPEYFIKEMDEDIVKNVENDIALFAQRIAPHLHISRRFVGEEPEDGVTDEYNCAMKRILPENGIQLTEIPRKRLGHAYISASSVRKCLADNDMEQLRKLVPESTLRILLGTDV